MCQTTGDLDCIAAEMTQNRQYVPIGWRLNFDRVEPEPTSNGRGKLVVFLDDRDIRKKALYDPFGTYNPYATHYPDHMGPFC